ncbi:hypothetical protein DMC25_04770 [Caulobacter sp. D4A]|nr:hypothetical protein DMC25_04770 [Caulobacter sp. D4A]PXA96628.1 hypothetical protein DMC18_01055 [Caulobacter sp. D5]
MDGILASTDLGNGCSIHIATLARNTVAGAGCDHLGFDGYFVFETSDAPASKGITILGKASSFEAALRLIDLWTTRPSIAA